VKTALSSFLSADKSEAVLFSITQQARIAPLVPGQADMAGCGIVRHCEYHRCSAGPTNDIQ